MWWKTDCHNNILFFHLILYCVYVLRGGGVIGLGVLLWLFMNRLFRHPRRGHSYLFPCQHVYNQICWPQFLYTASHPARYDLFLIKTRCTRRQFRRHFKEMDKDVSVDACYRSLKNKLFFFYKKTYYKICCHYVKKLF